MKSSKDILTAAFADARLEGDVGRSYAAFAVLREAVVDVLSQIDGELDAVRDEGYQDGWENGWYDGRAEHDEGE